jgi:putative transcriptional regulator
MTDEEAYQNALADEDSQPMTPQQLARMRRAPNPRTIRDRLGWTQKEFARQFQIAVGTLRDWEQGIHVPDSTATAFLRVIERDPGAVLRALHAFAPEHGIEVRAVTQARPWSYTNDFMWSGIEAAPTATAEMKVTLDPVNREA